MITHPEVQDSSVAARAEYYGDEEQRLEALRALSYQDFKQSLFDIRNTHSEVQTGIMQREDTFVNRQNFNMGGEWYSRAEDKDELLKYALEQAQAQDDMQVAALILGAAVGVTHPFADGNGRTSRTLYSYLSRGLNDEHLDYRKVRLNGHHELVDLSRAENGELTDHFIYQETGIPKIAEQVWFADISLRRSERRHDMQQEFAGLSEPEADELYGLLSHRIRGVFQRSAMNSVIFGLSKLQAEGGLHTEPDSPIYVRDLLATMDREAKLQFIEYMQEYYSLRAKTVVDLLGKFGDTVMDIDGQQAVKVRDYLVSQTKNYVAQTA